MNKVILTLLLSLNIVISAHSQIVFSFSSDTISTPGGTVDVDVSVSGFQDIISMQLSLNWDASVFSFSSIENVTTELPDFSASSIGTPDNAVVVDDGELTISWSGPGTQPESIPNGTRLFTLRLTGVGDLCGSTQVDISNSPRQIEVVDADFNVLDATSNGGNIDIYDTSCPGSGGGNNLSFSMDNVSAAQGSTICIPLTADNFNEILSFQTGIRWDPSILSFTGLTDAGLQSVTTNEADISQGELRVLWFFDQAAVSLANGATLFELCFEVVGSTGGSTAVSMVNLPSFDIEVADENGAIGNFDISNAVFTVGSGGGTMTGVGLIAPNIFTDNNPSICIPVTTRNFDSVAALQTGISFDPSILTFTEIRDGALSNVDVGNTNAAQGELRVLWQSDFSTPSVTLADNTVLFELCFNVVGSDGARSEIGFVNLANFAVEFSSEIGQSLEFFLQDGSITVGMATSGSDFTLTASNATINRGSTSCLDMTVTGFTNIQGMGFALQWDPSVVTYVEQRNFNLQGLGNSNFSTSGNDRLRILWTPTSSQSVADGTSIFQVCFQANDPCGANSTSSVAFISDNTPIEIIDNNDQVLDPTLNNGLITIGNCGGSNLGITVVSLTHPTCNGSTNGVVSVDFTDAMGTVMCLWRRDSDGLGITANCNLIGAAGGSYTLTASDQSGTMATQNVVLNDPSAIVVEGDIIDGSCTGSGQISLRISGGTTSSGSYGLLWSSGLPPNLIVTDLGAGTYQVTVSDDNGCQQVASFVVEDTSFPLNPSIANNNSVDNPNGAINLNPGGTVNLSYSWSNGATTSSISNLEAGTYTVTITDNTSSCSTERSYVVDNGFVSGQALVDGVTGRYNGFGVSCNGEADGILDGDIIGGCLAGPVTILLNGSEITIPADNLPAGDHVLRLEDACGNIYEENFTIEEPDAIVNNGLTVTTCPIGGSSNGTVTLDLSGGTGTYSISSSIGSQGSGNSIVNVSKDPFTAIVQDENGCQVMFENLEILDSVCPDGLVDGPCSGRSIISPNGDNVNDAFVIPCVNDTNAQPNNLTIFDRWGNLVMEAANYNNDWIGTNASGEPLPEGGYMWVLTTGGPGNRDLFRGTVSILR